MGHATTIYQNMITPHISMKNGRFTTYQLVQDFATIHVTRREAGRPGAIVAFARWWQDIAVSSALPRPKRWTKDMVRSMALYVWTKRQPLGFNETQ